MPHKAVPREIADGGVRAFSREKVHASFTMSPTYAATRESGSARSGGRIPLVPPLSRWWRVFIDSSGGTSFQDQRCQCQDSRVILEHNKFGTYLPYSSHLAAGLGRAEGAVGAAGAAGAAAAVTWLLT